MHCLQEPVTLDRARQRPSQATGEMLVFGLSLEFGLDGKKDEYHSDPGPVQQQGRESFNCYSLILSDFV